MLHAYWVAVERVVPDHESPKKYTLQKGQGANILHGIYPAILDSVRSGTTENPNAAIMSLILRLFCWICREPIQRVIWLQVRNFGGQVVMALSPIIPAEDNSN